MKISSTLTHIVKIIQNRTKNAPKGQITFHDEKSNIFAKTSQL